MTLKGLLKSGIDELKSAGISDAEIDARLLLEHIFGINRAYILAHGDDEVYITPKTAAQNDHSSADDKIENDAVYITQNTDAQNKEEIYKSAIKKRAARIPLQHITGTQEFMGLTFKVNENVLIPRQDTEVLVEEALKCVHDGMRILDMCTGSGCILISLLKYSNGCTGVGADISDEALKVAKENADTLLGGNDIEFSDGAIEADFDYNAPLRSVKFTKSDLFNEIDGQFDIIVSNPPYIQSAIIDTLEPEVRDYDPRAALDGGTDGLFFYRRIINDMDAYLKGGGVCLFEIGYDEGEAVSKLLSDAGYKYIEIIKDLAGLSRVIKAVKPCLIN